MLFVILKEVIPSVFPIQLDKFTVFYSRGNPLYHSSAASLCSFIAFHFCFCVQMVRFSVPSLREGGVSCPLLADSGLHTPLKDVCPRLARQV